MISRRDFLAASAALPFSSSLLVSAAHTPRWVLMGTDKGEGLYRARWDSATGTLGVPELAAATPHPSFTVLHPAAPVLFCSNELPGTGPGGISSFALDRDTASLAPLQSVSSGGSSPCYLTLNPAGTRLFAANYGGGSGTAFAVDTRQRLTGAGGSLFCSGNDLCGGLGPVTSRQEAHHMHCVVVSPDSQWLLACDLGGDALFLFPLEPVGAAALGAATRIPMRAGSGPRHLAFHPNGRWLYCINELDCTLELLDWNPASADLAGKLKPRPAGVISTLPPGVAAQASSAHPNTACELVLSDDGRFLYANTRGANTLAVYTIGPEGLLTEQQRLPTGGTVTRMIALDPTRRWLLCAHQGSSGVTVFPRDPATGRLGAHPKTFPANTPMSFQFV